MSTLEEIFADIDRIHHEIRRDTNRIVNVVPVVVVSWSILSFITLLRRSKRQKTIYNYTVMLPHVAFLLAFIETTGAFEHIEKNMSGLSFVANLLRLLPVKKYGE